MSFKSRWKQIKYYVLATVAVGSIVGGLSVVGEVTTGNQANIICAVGDTGENNNGQAAVTQAIRDEGCQTLLMLGDLVYPVGIKDENDPRFKTHFWNYYEDFEQVVVTLGNHDGYSASKGVEAWVKLGQKYSNLIYPSHFFLHKMGEICVFSWFSEIPERDEENVFSTSQDAFAAQIDLSGCSLSIAIAHHPYKSSGEHGDCSKNVCAFYEKNINGKFDYVFAGKETPVVKAKEEKMGIKSPFSSVSRVAKPATNSTRP
jgi:hypothetical protein